MSQILKIVIISILALVLFTVMYILPIIINEIKTKRYLKKSMNDFLIFVGKHLANQPEMDFDFCLEYNIDTHKYEKVTSLCDSMMSERFIDLEQDFPNYKFSYTQLPDKLKIYIQKRHNK